MLPDGNWFSEVCEEGGSAFSFKIKQKLHEEQSVYQKIEIYETETFGKLMVLDGCVMLTDLDNFLYHEMMSHPALYTHPNPRKVLIIGGGDCGTLKQVLKHPQVEAAYQIDIDERVTYLSEQYFPALCESNHDPRAQLHFADGIQWVKEAAAGSYDLIIVDSTDPIGSAVGLFSKEFYRDCHKALGDDGILVQQSESPLYHQDILKNMYQALRDAGFEQLATLHFPQPVYPSGWWSATLAGTTADLTRFRKDDADKQSFKTKYYNAEIHAGALAMPNFIKDALGELV